MSNRTWAVMVPALGALLLVGCSAKLETGYVPRKLGDTDNQRRAYYADRYSPEARAAEQDKQKQLGARRPAAGY